MQMESGVPLYTCNICKLEFTSNNIKYSPDGKKVICIRCYDKAYKKEQKPETARKSNIELRESSTRKEPLHGSIMVICTHCKYKFNYRPHLKPLCPYCGKGTLKKYEEYTAQKLINDSTNNGL